MSNPHHQFRPGIVRDVMVFIVGQMLDPRTLWRDEFRLETWSRSPRSIATAFGLLQRTGLVQRMKQRRRSQIGRWRGRMVWKYRLTSVSRAFAFTSANAAVLFEDTDDHHTADEPEARTMTSVLHAEATDHSCAAACAAYVFETDSGTLSLIPAIGPEAAAATDADLADTSAPDMDADEDPGLGHPRRVESTLKFMLLDVIQARTWRQNGEIDDAELNRLIVSAMETTAKYFLGEHPDHRPVVGWNQPGGIDAHIATELNLGEPDPTQRVMCALWSLLTEICTLVKQEEDGMPEETRAGRWTRPSGRPPGSCSACRWIVPARTTDLGRSTDGRDSWASGGSYSARLCFHRLVY